MANTHYKEGCELSITGDIAAALNGSLAVGETLIVGKLATPPDGMLIVNVPTLYTTADSVNIESVKAAGTANSYGNVNILFDSIHISLTHGGVVHLSGVVSGKCVDLWRKGDTFNASSITATTGKTDSDTPAVGATLSFKSGLKGIITEYHGETYLHGAGGKQHSVFRFHMAVAPAGVVEVDVGRGPDLSKIDTLAFGNPNPAT